MCIRDRLTRVFTEISRVLKPDHYAAVVFHAAKAKIWEAFEHAILDLSLIHIFQGLRATLAADGAKYAQKLGQWIYYGKPIGDFGTEYTYRAMVALSLIHISPSPFRLED